MCASAGFHHQHMAHADRVVELRPVPESRVSSRRSRRSRRVGTPSGWLMPHLAPLRPTTGLKVPSRQGSRNHEALVTPTQRDDSWGVARPPICAPAPSLKPPVRWASGGHLPVGALDLQDLGGAMGGPDFGFVPAEGGEQALSDGEEDEGVDDDDDDDDEPLSVAGTGMAARPGLAVAAAPAAAGSGGPADAAGAAAGGGGPGGELQGMARLAARLKELETEDFLREPKGQRHILGLRQKGQPLAATPPPRARRQPAGAPVGQAGGNGGGGRRGGAFNIRVGLLGPSGFGNLPHTEVWRWVGVRRWPFHRRLSITAFHCLSTAFSCLFPAFL